MLGLGPMQSGGPCREWFGWLKIWAVTLHVMLDSFFPARDREQFTVTCFCPVPIQPCVYKRPIKGNTVSIPFGIGQCTIDIKDQRLKVRHSK